MSANPTLAPRKRNCWVCDSIAVPADVTIRMYDENLEHIPLDAAALYIREVGWTSTTRALMAALLRHRRHVDKFIDEDKQVAAAHIVEGVVVPMEKPVPTKWVDANQAGIDVGMEALELARRRLSGMEDSDLISVAKLGQAATSKRADLEFKGVIRRQQQVAALASGFRKPADES